MTIAKSTSISGPQLTTMREDLGLAPPRKGLEMEGWLREDGIILSNVFAPMKRNKLYYAEVSEDYYYCYDFVGLRVYVDNKRNVDDEGPT